MWIVDILALRLVCFPLSSTPSQHTQRERCLCREPEQSRLHFRLLRSVGSSMAMAQSRRGGLRFRLFLMATATLATAPLAALGQLTQAYQFTRTSGSGYGTSVAISADGARLAVGSPGTVGSQGYVEVYGSLNDNSPPAVLLGTGSDFYGSATAMSRDGNVVAVGDNHTNTVKVYTASWSQIGSTLSVGSSSFDFGLALSLSATGHTLAVGYKASSTAYNGAVRVFR